MTSIEIRKKFLKFFEERGHKIVPSSSLLPTDPSVLFTTAGMQQFKPYYTGGADSMKDFGSLNTASIQKCIRTSDIDEVGDESHLTFFEMLGNFSFGGYWKKEAIEYAYEFITKEMGLIIDYVSVFGGSNEVPADVESEKIWKLLNPKIEIRKAGINDNFWGPTGNEGPCGPTTEIYVGGIEIWNLVFNEFFYAGSREELLSGTSEKHLEPLKTSGIDTGMGLERLAMVVQKKNNIFETDLFESYVSMLDKELPEKTKRIIVDHLRAITFMISDGVQPSNKEAGYILRRLMRKLITYTYSHNIGKSNKSLQEILEVIIHEFKTSTGYSEIDENKIYETYNTEYGKFFRTIGAGLKELNRILDRIEEINAELAFKLYESFGLPFEIIKEFGGEKTKNLTRESFDTEFKKHQAKSREGSEKKFGGHGLLLDTGELKAGNEEELKKATRLHTATHLLHAALRKVLGPPAGGEVQQAGSDITAERLRFDFTFPRKVTSEEIKKVEDLVNEIIQKDYKVTKEEMPYEDAIKSGALAFFKLKYPNRVNVYTIGPELARSELVEPAEGQFFSKELCGGPHVTNTGMIGRFKITKEESISVGTRRIRAIVE